MRIENICGALVCLLGVWLILTLIKQNRLKNNPVDQIAVDVLEDFGEYELESALTF
jgi:hypothetical protein